MPGAARSPLGTRPFRFGVQASGAADRAAWVALARRVEELGYASLTMPDHFNDQLAPIPALQCAADATSRLRLGTLVHANDYKHPVVLARELATLDLLSEGRIDIGLGAGWMESDYTRAGIAYDPPGVRVDRLAEAVAVVKGALSGEEFSFAGDHYTVSGYRGAPRPVQAPVPWIIGGGSPRVLRLAAEQADVVGINGDLRSGVLDARIYGSLTADAADRKLGWVTEAATAAGRLDAIELHIRVFSVTVTDDVDAVTEPMAELLGVTPEAVLESPHALIGPPAKIVDDLRARRDRWGFSFVTVSDDALEALAPVVAELAGT